MIDSLTMWAEDILTDPRGKIQWIVSNHKQTTVRQIHARKEKVVFSKCNQRIINITYECAFEKFVYNLSRRWQADREILLLPN
jgi:hypothetical protein